MELKQRDSVETFQESSYLSSNNTVYIETLYEHFLRDPRSVNEGWFRCFCSLSQHASVQSMTHSEIRESDMVQRGRFAIIPSTRLKSIANQTAVSLLISAYRQFGYFKAKINPLKDNLFFSEGPCLELHYYNLTMANFEEKFFTDGLLHGPQTLKEIYNRLCKVYCGSIGIQFNTILNEQERSWLQYYMEHRLYNTPFNREVKRSILRQLISAETLEKYLEMKYVGQIRYSLEGGESLIPLLRELIEKSCENQIDEVVICMAHRGRINVLLNVMGQSAAELFQEFEGGKKGRSLASSGDVKYHRGYSQDVKVGKRSIHLSLAFNPSHLEFICPVVMGSVRARQERKHKQNPDYAMAIMIHGDAAFSGEGIIMEILNMSQTRAYYIGGSIHVILNNQLGFTTSNPKDARSSLYCTDIAKMIDAPVLHVNGDDPEAVILVIQLALDYRMKFHKDIFIDLVCYRRHGHQEVDDPMPTQPKMYKTIQKHSTTRDLYARDLVEKKICTAKEIDVWVEKYRTCLDEGRQIVNAKIVSNGVFTDWFPYLDKKQTTTMVIDTTISLKKLKTLGKRLFVFPNALQLHRKVLNIYKARLDMLEGKIPIDWGFGEMIAYASLLSAGHSVRLVGQDSRRGTFFHRHAVVFDQDTGEEYEPLKSLENKQAKVYIYDSLLCETGALGFEYGYSATDPKSLIIWEAQFGDFANVAQVIVDQFISSGWQKWNRLSNVVMFLPHGYEGKGPEHSSARLERYLQLCAQNNIQVCVPTTPAQIFHLLRRQVFSSYRKPLIVMTPKSLLRHKLAVSSLEDLTHGQLKLIIPEIDLQDLKKVKQVVLCSGKVYYDLLIKRRENGLNDIALIRIEQLYPFPYEELRRTFERFSNLERVVWCQEEPKNQGAWFYIRHRLERCLQDKQQLGYVGRPDEAAPATGYSELHLKVQNKLISEALNL
ncbi:2-oxoglutarate dehydrogenase E1 component [Coxiella-like endosymbiont of Amblyomma americanum]|uniref:2-oxoglutarate dehydrogenase E1 component n=1 Tax=Coxiella-like endosymbiont of Amblyomma americanum TaxID=1987500 RepID=UPI000F89DEA5|nr:2-oxoglutarate dehydrogenase E1 component [Coxiella-like endosymbiont of Amblyomma americanum]